MSNVFGLDGKPIDTLPKGDFGLVTIVDNEEFAFFGDLNQQEKTKLSNTPRGFDFFSYLLDNGLEESDETYKQYLTQLLDTAEEQEDTKQQQASEKEGAVAWKSIKSNKITVHNVAVIFF